MLIVYTVKKRKMSCSRATLMSFKD